jgi:hypothetical protein
MTNELTDSTGQVLGIRESLTNVRPMTLLGDHHPLRALCAISRSPAVSAGDHPNETVADEEVHTPPTES